MRKILLTLAVGALLFAMGPAYAILIDYTVSGWGPTRFPGPVTPPAGSPWGPNGYPGDTVELLEYTGTLDLTPGTYLQKINTLLWAIDYTYAGTATQWDYPAHWTDPLFISKVAARGISFDGGPTGTLLTQTGTVESQWENDFLSFSSGSTAHFWVTVDAETYQIDVTPLEVVRQAGTDFSGGNPWVQPNRDMTAQFDVTLIPEPVSMVMLGCLGVGMAAARKLRRQKS